MNQIYKSEKIMFIVKGLEKILSDRDIKKSYNQQLKKACENALGNIWLELFLYYSFIISILFRTCEERICYREFH